MPEASDSGKGMGLFMALGVVGVLVVSAGVWWVVAHKAAKKTRPPAVTTWSSSATRYRAQLGESIQYQCSPGGRARSVWGSGPYTADSSVCTAAVHAGLISFSKGGTVTITISKGQHRYTGSRGHGVKTSSFGHYGGSFYFKAATPELPGSARPAGPARATWTTTPATHRQQRGRRFEYHCPPGGSSGKVWGSGPYTLDSSVCNAAVHAGVITRSKGGRITVKIAKGRSAYSGSSRNGVTTSRWAAFHTSFHVIGTPTPEALPTPP